MSPQLQQLLDQARQLSPQERLVLLQQLVDEDGAETDLANDLRSVVDHRMAQMEAAALATGLVERVAGGLVVKGEPGEVLDLDLVEFVKQGREERMEEVLGW